MLNLRDFEEHICVSFEEKEWLKSKGIRYTFVKEDGFILYKYKKEKKLYEALAEYYDK